MSDAILAVGKAKVFLKRRLIRGFARIVACARLSLGDYMSLKVDIFWNLPVNMFVMPNVPNQISISV